MATKKKAVKAGVDDLVLLAKVTEDQILENLKVRYASDLIYTNIGPVLISVNPFKNLGISGEEYVEMYRGKIAHELPPHVFALAEQAYRSMKDYHENQCVIISGESGAGKTEASKLIMQYISSVSGKSEKVEYVKHVILESNPLLEAFGNAKTLRNNNSSRFGKYFEIQFDKAGDPVGGRITNYLLEKSRVCFQTPGERNFHIFYQLLAGASEQEKANYALSSPDYYFYLNQGACYTVDGMNDAQEYADVRNAMNVIGMSPQEQDDVFRLVASVLHLGNVTFTEDKAGNAQIADPETLTYASTLLQVPEQSLSGAILSRVVNTGGAGGARRSTYNVPQNVEQACVARDALAKSIYDRMFSWLVVRVNTALQLHKAPFQNVIGILDIFGFEIFEKNGFEQFCINFVNEKLQQFFIEKTLKEEQEEYVREGIKWEPIKYFNNQIVCDLIEGKAPPGIFSLLDDICYTIHAQSAGTDLKFMEKMSGTYGSHLHWKAMTGAFAVKHYAGEVTYEAEGFTDKNKDNLFSDLIETMQCSSNQFLIELFPDDTGGAQKKRPTTAGFKIKTSATELMKTLAACTPHYIRCIKPNETKKPRDFEDKRVRHQVQYLGLLENVRVRRAGFCYRGAFDRFIHRYKKLSQKTYKGWGGDPKEGALVILNEVQMANDQYQMGVSKVFIRHPETLFSLEERLEKMDYDAIVRIQKSFRSWKAKRHALEQRAWAADLLRNKKERRRASVDVKFTGDKIDLENNAALMEIMAEYKKERVLFADKVKKYDRRAKVDERHIICTDAAVYIIIRQVKNKVVTHLLSRRTTLRELKGISLSTLADNMMIFHVPEYDWVLENEHKTEIVTHLSEAYKALTNGTLQLNFTDKIPYTLKKGAEQEAGFVKNEQATMGAIVKKGGKGLLVGVATGLPKDTDTTPQNFHQKMQASATPPMPSAGRGKPPGQSAPQQQQAKPAAMASAGAGAGRGAPMGMGAGAGAGAGRGAPMGAGRGAPMGGAGRGAPVAKPPPSVKPAAAAKPTCVAIYDYEASTDDELTFKEGDVITILQKDQNGWWQGELMGKKGWIPANYVQ
eukprot:TRINITY_DN5735_c1_g1_i3.p1 TRINITY_DN5735_c1_g1~~TRINITY_DN5735_c1_g1_i3.p1  ORF type:complete len:1071 (+),score=360.39 TRINITY_DN5735_c1_g1_i3:181-3393(+)